MLSETRRRQLARLRRRKARRREGLVLVEGVRCVNEALASDLPPRWAVCSPRLRHTEAGEALAGALEARTVETIWVEEAELAEMSDTETSQGVILVVDEPRTSLATLPSVRHVVIADGVQDPGNLGTLIRAALAFGADAFVALDGTTDPWGPKTVRSAAGACFRIPVAHARWPEVRPWLEERHIPLLVATAAGEDVAESKPGTHWALAIGSEARGVRRELDAVAAARVAVPMPGGIESLNAGVAGAILLYVLTRNARDV